MAGVLIGCALPGVALAGADPPPPPAAPPPAAAAAPPPPVVAPQPYAAPPYVAPPPYAAPAFGSPQGAPYGYPPAPGLPSAYFTAQRLALLDAQIANLQLRREELSLAWPLTLLSGGGALTLVGIVMPGSAGCSTDKYGKPTDPNCVQDQGAVDLSFGLIMLGVVGLGMGTLLLIIHGAKRSHLGRQIAARQLEANALRGLPSRWSVAPSPNGGGTFSLALDF